MYTMDEEKKYPKNGITVSFVIPPDLHRRLEIAFWELRMKKGEIMKQALIEFFDRHNIPAEPESK